MYIFCLSLTAVESSNAAQKNSLSAQLRLAFQHLWRDLSTIFDQQNNDDHSLVADCLS